MSVIKIQNLKSMFNNIPVFEIESLKMTYSFKVIIAIYIFL